MRRVTVLFVAIVLTGFGSVHAAEDLHPDKFKFTLGAYSVVRYDSKVALSDTNVGTGVFIDPQESLGLDSEQTVARITGYYRFNENHALDFSYYRISSDASRTLEEEIDWVDEDGNDITIPVGANVSSSLDYQILKLGYLWSFYHTDKVELAAGAGLHLTRIGFDLAASSTSSGGDTQNARTTVPLPVFSFVINYTVTPRLSWLYKTEVFGLKYSDVTGTYTDNTLALEYRFVKHFGVGFGLSSSSLDVRKDESDREFAYENKISGVLLYASVHF